MKLLTLSQLRFLRFAPWSSITVLAGVALAVSSIVAVHQISRQVIERLDSVTPPYLASVTHFLDRPDATMDDYFLLRADWRRGEVPGLLAMMPLVEGSVMVDGRVARVVGLDGFSGIAALLGVALLPANQLLAGSATGLSSGDEVLLDGRSYRIGYVHDALPVDIYVTDIGTAQVALGRSDESLSRVAVIMDSPSGALMRWAERMLPGISAGFEFDGLVLPGWDVRSLAADLPSLAFARSILFNLGALGSLALVVAWLLVFQVGVIWLRRRQHTLARLRQMGVSDRELRGGFLLSLLALGLVASVIGIAIGMALARALVSAVGGSVGAASGGFDLPDVWLVAKAMGSAALVCLLGGWFAYERERAGERHPGRQWAITGVVLLAGIAGVTLTDSLLGGFISIAAAGLVVLVAVNPVLRRLRGVSRRLPGGLLTRIGMRELVWYPNDLAVAVGALSLALATSIAIALMVDSFRHDFELMLDQRMNHDIYVNGAGRDLTQLADGLRARSDVVRVQAYGSAEQRIDGERVLLGYSEFDAHESARYGLAGRLEAGEALVSERLARVLGLGKGDRLRLSGESFEVAGMFPGFGDPLPRLIIDAADAGRLNLPLVFDRLSIISLDPEPVMGAIREVDSSLDVQSHRALRDTALEIFDQTFAITRALTLLALIVACVGLYNALLALKLLQQRTRRLLQAMGVSHQELAGIERTRVLAVGVAALFFALPLGLVMGWLLCQVINPRAFGWSIEVLLTADSLFWPVLSAIVAMALVSLVPTPEEGLLDER